MGTSVGPIPPALHRRSQQKAKPKYTPEPLNLKLTLNPKPSKTLNPKRRATTPKGPQAQRPKSSDIPEQILSLKPIWALRLSIEYLHRDCKGILFSHSDF